jgi:hypothetical protein
MGQSRGDKNKWVKNPAEGLVNLTFRGISLTFDKNVFRQLGVFFTALPHQKNEKYIFYLYHDKQISATR